MEGKGWLVAVVAVVFGLLLLCGAGMLVGALIGVSVAQEPVAAPAPAPAPAGNTAETSVTASCTGIIVAGSCNGQVDQEQRPVTAAEAGTQGDEMPGWGLALCGFLFLATLLALGLWGPGEF